MTDQAIAAAPSAKGSASLRPFLWLLFQLTALAAVGFLILQILGWTIQSPALIAAVGISLLPQIVVTWALVERGTRAPSLSLWFALVLVCTVALGLALWAATHELSIGITIVGVTAFAWAPGFLSLWFLDWRAKDSRRWLVQGINILAASYALIVTGLYATARYLGGLAPEAWTVVTLLGLIVAQPLLANVVQAVSERRFPVKPGGNPKLTHISGLGVITLSLFTVSIVGLGLWAATRTNGAFINQEAGLIVEGGLAAAFLLVAIAPNFQASDDFLHHLRSGPIMRAIGGTVSTIDGLLVFSVAGAMGTSQPNNPTRYLIMIAHLVAAAFLGWWLPAPYGLIAIAWAVVASIAVSRRWAWIEEDRENAMLNRQFEGAHIKVGFDQDLRDEALFGFTSLLVLLPLALRQVHEAFGGDLFVVTSPADADSFFAWITFFGTELAKAVPFVDWAEVYQVRGNARIHVDDTTVGAAQHVIFATRVLTDLVLLATLVQAIAIGQRASKLKEMFYQDRTLNRLDPFTEAKAFRKLVEGDRNSWVLVQPVDAPFLTYDEDRLEELQIKHEGDAIGFAAGELLRLHGLRSPELLLVEEARLAKPDPDKLEEYLERTRLREEVSIHDLKAAQYFLNSSAKLRVVREEIVRIIADNWRAEGAISALCDILMSKEASDSRYEVRLQALNGLYQPALNNDRSAQVAIAWAARYDAAQRVRGLGQEWIAKHPDWDSGSPNPPNSTP